MTDVLDAIRKDPACSCAVPVPIVRDGVLVCRNCGTVYGPEYTVQEIPAYGAEEIRARRRTEPRWRNFGPRTLLQVDGPACPIRSITRRTDFIRLAKIQRSLCGSIERNLWEARPILQRMVFDLNLPPHVRDTAWMIYIQCARRQYTCGRSIQLFIDASIYIAIRIHKIPLFLKELHEVSQLHPSRIVRAAEMIRHEVLPALGLTYSHPDLSQILLRIMNRLNLNMNIQTKAQKVIQVANTRGMFNGKNPRGIIAAVIYLMVITLPAETRPPLTQTSIAKAAKITEVTLRTRLKLLKKEDSLLKIIGPGGSGADARKCRLSDVCRKSARSRSN